MILASYAIGYNFLLGYTGLMSLGHAMFFSTGMYSMGLSIYYLELSPINGLIFSIIFTIFIIVIFDISSYLLGSKYGKFKILPIISPNKTLFGLTSGIFLTVSIIN